MTQTYAAAMGFGGALIGDDFVDRGRREITFVTTSDHAHHNGNVVISAGIDWRNFAANPLLLLGHEGGERDWRALPLGKWTARRDTRLPDGVPGVMSRARFANEEQVSKGSDAWHLADSVYRMALPENSIVNTTSISWTEHDAMPPKPIRHQSGLTGKYFQRSNMVEQSIVLIPANQQAQRVEASTVEDVLRRAASAHVITGDEATLVGRYVGVVRPYEVAGMGAVERLQGVNMPGVGGWVPFQPERLVGAVDGTLRSVPRVEPEVAEGEPARTVASAPAGEASAEKVGGPILSSGRTVAGGPSPAARSRLGTQRIDFNAADFADSEACVGWLRASGYETARVRDLTATSAGFYFHPKDGKLVGPSRVEALAPGVTAILRVRAREEAGGAAAAAGQATPPARFASASERHAYMRVVGALNDLKASLAPVGGFFEDIEGGALTPEQTREALQTAALVASDLSGALARLVGGPGASEGAAACGPGGTHPDDEEENAAAKVPPMRASTKAKFGKGDPKDNPDDTEEEQTEPSDNPDEEGQETDSSGKKKKAPPFQKAAMGDPNGGNGDDEKEGETAPDDEESEGADDKTKTPESEAVKALEKASQQVAALIAQARRSRQKAVAPAPKSDARGAAPREAAAYQAAHDRIRDLLASRGAPTAPVTSQGGEQNGAAAAVK